MIDVCPGFPDRLHPGRKWIVSWFSGRRPSRSPDVKNEVTPNLETYKWTFIVEKERVNNQTSWASGAILECVHNRLQMYVKYVSPHYAGEGEGFFLTTDFGTAFLRWNQWQADNEVLRCGRNLQRHQGHGNLKKRGGSTRRLC